MIKKLTGNTIIGFLFSVTACITLYMANTSLPATAPAGDPGSRVFPSVISAAILVLGLIIIIQSLIKPDARFSETFATTESKESCIRAVLILADLIMFLLLWKYIPFLIAGIIFLFIQCMIFKEKILFSAIYSVSVTGVLYVMFAILLKVNLTIH